jgi:sugar O-acyltransferase (sialic acid O-acetyltransferase NeuD family)
MIIAGAGGHAREIYMLLDRETKATVYFFDNVSDDMSARIGEAEILRTESDTKKRMNEDRRFIIGVGSPVVRKRLCDLLLQWGGLPYTFQAVTAFVSEIQTIIGEGSNIMHDAFISSNVTLGKGCLVNARANLHHDVVAGDFCEIGPAALLLGNVTIGNGVFIGAGAILLPGIEVADGAIIGAGAVVTKNVTTDRTVKGVPAV